MDIRSEVVKRFLRYVAVETTSSEETGTHPSMKSQFELASLLADELETMGLQVNYDVEHCYIYCKIKGRGDLPAIGFISHMDTSPDASGRDIRPQIIEDYDGKDIILGSASGSCSKVLSPESFPELLNYVGQTLITTDGTTLLGADDKAGIAEIMTMASYIVSHPEINHGDICIAFTPDEEIGEGTMFFDLEGFGADYAYTVDGGIIGEISYENFNAASAVITVNGRNVHPGDAYGKMINSMRVAMEIDALIPGTERPETTRDHEGFYHLTDISGDVEKTVMKYIIRDHDKALFEEKKDRLKSICTDINVKYPGAEITAEIKDTYYNMREVIVRDNMYIVNRCIAAMERAGINPIILPIRGGTDGATLTNKGLPCPNICSGGHNYHGIYEYVCVESMEKITDLLVEIVKGVCYE